MSEKRFRADAHLDKHGASVYKLELAALKRKSQEESKGEQRKAYTLTERLFFVALYKEHKAGDARASAQISFLYPELNASTAYAWYSEYQDAKIEDFTIKELNSKRSVKKPACKYPEVEKRLSVAVRISFIFASCEVGARSSCACSYFHSFFIF